MEEPQNGEYPALNQAERAIIWFSSAILCKHNVPAHLCSQRSCFREDWLDCLVREKNPNSQSETPRAVRDVINEFVREGVIVRVEVIEKYFKEERKKMMKGGANRIAAALSRYKKSAAIAGLTIIGGALLYEGGKLILRMWAERRKK
ncbi:MAG: hypothetical protein HYV53_01535 [Parcubacteria group bacterium]|nr:hypothetical protein [Parcubacteria group bacterium]